MKIFKKITAVLLSAVTAFSVSAFAAWDTEENVLSLLNGLKIMEGDGNGNYRLDDYVSRGEFAKVAAAASPVKDTVAVGLKISPFKDVKYTDWFAPYVQAAVSGGLCEGYIDGTFRPENTVTYEEAITMLLRALGYTDQDFGVSWPYGQVGMAQNLEMTKYVNASIGEPLTRGQVARLVYNTLNTKQKSGIKLITIFDCTVTEGATIIASHNEDSSLGTDKIYTTVGILEINDNFNSDYIGRQGDIVVKNGDDFVSFTPREQSVEEYTVTNVIGKDLILDSQILDINENTTAYFKSQAMTYGTIAQKASKGDKVRIVRSSAGSVDCVLLSQGGGSEGKNNLDRYVIYSLLDNAVICYKNGAFRQIDVKDTTTCYRDTLQSTYGTIKNEMEMGDILYVKMNGSTVDYVSYEKGSMEGPVKVTSSSWMSQFETDSSTQIMRDGNKVSQSAILTNDIVYFCKDLNMVLAYTDKVTGIYESASPSKDAPTSIKLSGKEYKVESVEAFNALSSSGSLKIGDTITLLLGRNGDVAGVLGAGENTETTKVGYVIGSGTKTFTNSLGQEYTGFYAKLVGTDGAEGEYEVKSNADAYVGKVCKISFKGGEGSLTSVSSAGGVSGTVSSSDMKIGSTKLDENVKILDAVLAGTYDSAACRRIYPQRLDGITINSSNVLYCAKNSAGEVTDLILKDVTGDAYSYGIITAKKSGMETASVFTINVNGSVMSYSGGETLASRTPVKVFVGANGTVQTVRDLKSYSSVTSLSHTAAVVNGSSYTLSDSVIVYRIDRSYNVMKITLDDAINGDYRITAYYDKPESEGGRIRVITVQDK
ncbi:MAG: S-layer homology domain-containing protein [Clostridia bacterium]|nr:S-layer homology domain-containing protein [Clostridia bacterium]